MDQAISPEIKRRRKRKMVVRGTMIVAVSYTHLTLPTNSRV